MGRRVRSHARCAHGHGAATEPRRATSIALETAYSVDARRRLSRQQAQHRNEGDSLRIAQIAPPFESIPPTHYGGTERVVSLLTEELVRRGHEVTLFASGDSTTSARLVPVTPEALRLAEEDVDPSLHLMLELGMVFEDAGEFDVIHSHVDYFALPLA